MLKGVTIDQLQTLLAVVEAGSFSAAARQLGRVQAAVSQSVDRLEAQLELRLFDRTGRTPRLTPHGEAIVATATRVNASVDALAELVESLKQGAERSLSIVVDVLFPTESLVAFAQDLAREHPEVALVMWSDTLSAVTAHVREKRSAFGVAIEDADLADLERRPIADLELVPVVAPGHALALRQGPIETAALAESVQIVLGEHRAEAGRTPADERGVFSPRTWRVVDLTTKWAFIAGGLGWGHMPEHLVREDIRSGRLVPLSLAVWGGAPPRRSLVLVWRRHAVLGPVARWAEDRLTHLCRRAMATPAPAAQPPGPPPVPLESPPLPK
jgi:DNA-binding transcriptional LysR family regulator